MSKPLTPRPSPLNHLATSLIYHSLPLPSRLYLSTISTAIISPKTRILRACSACYCSPALLSTHLSSPFSPHILAPPPLCHSGCTGLLHLRQCLTQKPTFSLACLAQTPNSRQNNSVQSAKSVVANIKVFHFTSNKLCGIIYI